MGKVQGKGFHALLHEQSRLWRAGHCPPGACLRQWSLQKAGGRAQGQQHYESARQAGSISLKSVFDQTQRNTAAAAACSQLTINAHSSPASSSTQLLHTEMQGSRPRRVKKPPIREPRHPAS